jgi:tRNA-2-methylthio-N6-dimethylallyladenosine synthase
MVRSIPTKGSNLVTSGKTMGFVGCVVLLLLTSIDGFVVPRQLQARTTAHHAVRDVPMVSDIASSSSSPELKKFFIETHGCTSNLADSDVVRAVLLKAGYETTEVLENADLILTNTCSIRENAESKMFQRLKYFGSLRKKARKEGSKPAGYPLIGVLGCMAERLKETLLDEYDVSFICGPDGYRTLPDLLLAASADQRAANVQLSLEETYADISPVRLVEGNVHAFVAISRGCNQHCAFCVVPYVRGVERSRPVESVLSEVSDCSNHRVMLCHVVLCCVYACCQR